MRVDAAVERLRSLEIEFLNDTFDRDTGRDRDLRIAGVAANSERLPLKAFWAPSGSEDAARITDGDIPLYRNGSVRYEAR